MINRKSTFTAASIVVASTVGLMSIASPAAADDDPTHDAATPDHISSLVERAADAAGASATPTGTPSTVEVAVPDHASDGIAVHTPDGSEYAVSSPTQLSLESGVVAADGSTVYVGKDGQPDVTVAPLNDGVRISTVLWDKTQTSTFDYRLPPGVNGEILQDGSVLLTRSSVGDFDAVSTTVATVVGKIEPAWAIDADGRSVPTAYALADGVLRQTVDTAGARFPVVADPKWGFSGPLQVRVRWNRAETATIANGGWGSAGMTGVCASAGGALAGAAGAAILGAGCLLTSSPAIYTAGVAQNSTPKRCLEGFLTYVPGVSIVVPWYGTYACR